MNGFYSVTDGVAKIEQFAFIVFFFVGDDDVVLPIDAALYEQL